MCAEIDMIGSAEKKSQSQKAPGRAHWGKKKKKRKWLTGKEHDFWTHKTDWAGYLAQG